MFRRGTKRPRFSVGGHSIFEHDDSSNHSGLGTVDYEEDSSSQQHTTSTNSSDANILCNQYIPDRPRRIQKSTAKSHHDDSTNLNACLSHLLRILSRKDKEGFFQYPVTDHFAPGYSQIITRPMDFSTMKKKINRDDYSNILEFRSDFELMCDNAMKYNRPDTIYWRAAKKLLAIGTKLMNKDKLISFRRSLECFSHLTERELGFRIDSSSHLVDEQTLMLNEQNNSNTIECGSLSSISLNQACSQRKPKLILKLPKYYEKVPASMPNDDEDEEILSQVQQAAQCAHEKLDLRRPICSYTLGYQRTNGTTLLHFVNQDNFKQQTITLSVSNNLPTNEDGATSSSLPIVDENTKFNHLLSRDFLDNGPFSLNPLPSDSSFSSLSKEELDLLINTYGSEFSAQYAVSLMNYVKHAGELALAYVDRFLSVLTNGEHDTFVAKRRAKQQNEEENENKPIETVSTSTVSSTDSLSALSANSSKVEPQINTNEHAEYDCLSGSLNQQHHVVCSLQTNEPASEYDLAEKEHINFNDMTNKSDNLMSSVNVHHG